LCGEEGEAAEDEQQRRDGLLSGRGQWDLGDA